MKRWVINHNWKEFEPEERCLHHTHYAKAHVWCANWTQDLNAKIYFLKSAIDRMACAFRHCNAIKSAQTRAHFRASITRMRNWLTYELRKLERSAHV